MLTNNILRWTATVFALVALAMTLAFSAFAQDKMDHQMDHHMEHPAKVTVAIIKAEWCKDCQKLGPTMAELIEQYKDRINFVVLDVTNDETTAQAAATARQLGITKFFEANKKNTSTVAVFGAKNKVLFQTAKNFDRDAYVRAFDDAIAKTS